MVFVGVCDLVQHPSLEPLTVCCVFGEGKDLHGPVTGGRPNGSPGWTTFFSATNSATESARSVSRQEVLGMQIGERCK